VGAVENRAAHILRPPKVIFELLRYERGFALTIVGLVVADLVTGAQFGAGVEGLRQPFDVPLDHAIGSVEYGLSRAIVLLQFDDFGASKVVLKPQDDVEVRAAPTID